MKHLSYLALIGMLTFGLVGTALADNTGNVTVTGDVYTQPAPTPVPVPNPKPVRRPPVPAPKPIQVKTINTLLKQFASLNKESATVEKAIAGQDKKNANLFKLDQKQHKKSKIDKARLIDPKAKAIREDIKLLQKAKQDDWKLFKDAQKDKNMKSAIEYLNRVMNDQKKINQKLRNILRLRQQQLDILL